jgi:hypothetical protein
LLNFRGVGSLKENTFRGFEYSHNLVNIFDDKNYTAYSDAHP